MSETMAVAVRMITNAMVDATEVSDPVAPVAPVGKPKDDEKESIEEIAICNAI